MSATTIAFKVSFSFQGEEGPAEIRRFSADATLSFDELCAKLRTLMPPSMAPKQKEEGEVPRLTLQYIDEEGDTISVQSETEWAEAVRLHTEMMAAAKKQKESDDASTSPLLFRLTARVPQSLATARAAKKKHSHHSHREMSTASSSSSDEAAAEKHKGSKAAQKAEDREFRRADREAARAARKEDKDARCALKEHLHSIFAAAARCNAPSMDGSGMCAGLGRRHSAGRRHCCGGGNGGPMSPAVLAEAFGFHVPRCCRREADASGSGSGSSDPDGGDAPRVVGETEHEKAVLELLSRTFRCDAGAKLARCPGFFRRVLTRGAALDPATGAFSLDIDVGRLSRVVVNQSCRMMAAGALEEAEHLLRKALGVFAGPQPVHEYNLACALALQEKTAEALSSLAAAVQHGFGDRAKIAADPDLRSLRGMDAFKAILEQCCKQAQRCCKPAFSRKATAKSNNNDDNDDGAECGNNNAADVVAAEDAKNDPEMEEEVVKDKSSGPAASAEVQLLMAILPQLSAADAQAALVAHGNHVARAVDAVLSTIC